MNFCKRFMPTLSRNFYLLLCVFLIVADCHKSVRDKQTFDSDLVKSVRAFRPLRRYIKNFYPDKTAILTIVFQGMRSPQIRWFINTPGNLSLPNAEIANKINIDGNKKFSVRSISSHDVTAVKLTITRLENHFPIEIVTCFNYKYTLFQYQLYTTITGPVNSSYEILDAVMWLNTPPYTIAYSLTGIEYFEGNITISCEARFESDSTSFIDEVNIYKTTLDTDRTHKKGLNDQLVSLGCGRMHRGRDNYTEKPENGKYTYIGSKESIKNHRDGSKEHRLLKMTFTITNGSSADSGVYTCMAERSLDKTFSSTWIRPTKLHAPTMIFAPCEETLIKTESPLNYHHDESQRKPVFVIDIVRYQPTCVRCRAFDYLTSQITLQKNDYNVTSSNDTIRLDNHINVADGALSELTITFLRPNYGDGGLFRCSLRDESGSDYVDFKINVVDPRRRG